MYTLKEIEQGQGLYTGQETVIWLMEAQDSNALDKRRFLTSERGDLFNGEIVGYAMPGEPIQWV